MKAQLYCDGASRGNPGDAGIGCLIILDNKKIEISEYIGKTTNNVAEYTALIRGLEETLKQKVQEIEIFSDSELLVRQINGVYKVRNKKLIPLYEKVKELLTKFKKYQIFHVYREENFIADRLAKEASWKQKK
ncbi:ribonuclease HI family protein [Thermodesulfovibrio sp. 3907-1M]|uniref:Ribonuclease HI family protein n=1 Tax=Thermodesulfovibrio autotrophicus TaxID=3118333 RepID=A0AAU8GXR7_9BACT